MSKLRLTTIANQGDTKSVPSETVIAGSAKAWVNFNGTGTVAIRDSFNVSSITDDGVGDYTVNLTTAMPNTNYSILGMAGGGNGGGTNPVVHVDTASIAVGSFSIWTAVGTAAPSDRDMISVAVMSN